MVDVMIPTLTPMVGVWSNGTRRLVVLQLQVPTIDSKKIPETKSRNALYGRILGTLVDAGSTPAMPIMPL